MYTDLVPVRVLDDGYAAAWPFEGSHLKRYATAFNVRDGLFEVLHFHRESRAEYGWRFPTKPGCGHRERIVGTDGVLDETVIPIGAVRRVNDIGFGADAEPSRRIHARV